MDLYPAIDLRGGQVVQLTQGDFDRERIHGDDPVAVAKAFVAAGARWIHTVEDVGIVLGQALQQALGEKRGVRRFANALVPLDEALVQVALDLSGRPFLVYDVEPVAEWIGTFDPQLAEEFWKGFVDGARVTLHLRSLSGKNGHHVIEASFKGVARALRDAVRVEGGDVPSTKGTLSG